MYFLEKHQDATPDVFVILLTLEHIFLRNGEARLCIKMMHMTFINDS
jgi:hypothetical protein